MSPPAESKPAPKSQWKPFFDEVALQLQPEWHGLAELLVNFREKPHPTDLARALFRARKFTAVLEEAQRQVIARGSAP